MQFRHLRPFFFSWSWAKTASIAHIASAYPNIHVKFKIFKLPCQRYRAFSLYGHSKLVYFYVFGSCNFIINYLHFFWNFYSNVTSTPVIRKLIGEMFMKCWLSSSDERNSVVWREQYSGRGRAWKIPMDAMSLEWQLSITFIYLPYQQDK